MDRREFISAIAGSLLATPLAANAQPAKFHQVGVVLPGGPYSARPGGRLTGVHSLGADLTAKRLEILKEISPKLRRVVTFYDRWRAC